MRTLTRFSAHFRAWRRYWTHCAFWGCQPPDDGSWWVTSRGVSVITPATKDYCGHCGRNLPE